MQFGLGLQAQTVELDRGRRRTPALRGDGQDQRVRGGGSGHRCIMPAARKWCGARWRAPHRASGLRVKGKSTLRCARAPSSALRAPSPVNGRRAAFKIPPRSEEHTSELQSLMRISYAVFCLKKKNTK